MQVVREMNYQPNFYFPGASVVESATGSQLNTKTKKQTKNNKSASPEHPTGMCICLFQSGSFIPLFLNMSRLPKITRQLRKAYARTDKTKSNKHLKKIESMYEAEENSKNEQI